MQVTAIGAVDLVADEAGVADLKVEGKAEEAGEEAGAEISTKL